MSLITMQEFLVDRSDLAHCELRQPKLDLTTLQPGQVVLQIDHFALTANNITYAAMGESMRYWRFFPALQGWGSIPVWGFAEVLVSRCEGVAVGERVYGFYPMASHLVIAPTQLRSGSFVDGSPHRQDLPALYNQYLRCAKDPLYNPANEGLQMLLRPLFTTSFLLDDFLTEQNYFGAATLVLTSASSKTAIGMAYLLRQGREGRGQQYQIVGLTSPGNRAFVETLGCYDRVLAYDQLAELDAQTATVTVDFAGNGELLGALHERFSSHLRYSCLVGAAHWDKRRGLPKELPGPAPQLFFAPAQAEKRLNDWGPLTFQQRLTGSWQAFTAFVEPWMQVEQQSGPLSVERVYRRLLAGEAHPQCGYVLSLATAG